MITLTCPHCGFSKVLDKTSIPPIGTKVTCPKCRCHFTYQEMQIEALSGSAGVLTTSAPPVADSASPPQPAPRFHPHPLPHTISTQTPEQLENYKAFGFITLGLAVLATLFVIVHISDHLRAFLNVGFIIIFVILPISPYIVMAYQLKNKSESNRKAVFQCITIMIVCVLGIYGMIDIVYIHSDAQGGIALAILPFLQFIAYFVLIEIIVPVISDFRLK